MKRLALVLAAAALAGAACKPKSPEAAPAAAPGAPASKPASASGGVQALIDAGQLDEALSRLDAAAGDADSLALLGVIWSKKAAAAPLPTPAPVPPGAKRGTLPVVPEFKEEELTALGFLEKALAAQPGHPRASLAVAELLGPHALRQLDLRQASQRKKAPRVTSELTTASGVDFSVERVAQAYKAAAAPGGPADALEKFYAFAARSGRLADAEWALEQGVERDKENPAPLIRFGDFLAQEKKDPRAAIERYREALIWRPDDEVTLGKIADIYIGEAIDLYNKTQYAVAQQRLLEAQKFVRNPNSPQGLRIKDYLAKIGSIRQSPR